MPSSGLSFNRRLPHVRVFRYNSIPDLLGIAIVLPSDPVCNHEVSRQRDGQQNEIFVVNVLRNKVRELSKEWLDNHLCQCEQ